jgi:Ca2+-binding EF-hand superfamily protein
MKLSTLGYSFVLAAFSLTAVGCGSADTTGASSTALTVATGPQAEARGRWGRRDPAQLVQRFDQNGDGALQVSELPAPMQARLGAADADHNGVIAVAELTAHLQARQAERFARADTNGDGALNAEEAGPQRWGHLGVADADHDGRVTRAELDAARASGAMMHHGGRGEGRGRGRGRGGHVPDPARMIQRFDANGDGSLQVSELPAPMQQRLAADDANHDGVLAVDELAAAITRHQAERAARQGANADDHDAE